jgi:glucokinase
MKNEKPCLLAGDIGGTKVNLGLFRPDSEGLQVVAEASYDSRSAGGLQALVEDLLARHPAAVAAACFGIAGPVYGGSARLTNLGWRLSETELRQRFGWQRIRLINDLAATALSVPWLGRGEVSVLKRGTAEREGNIALVAPGTGLGQALLVWENGRYLPLASEGGHVDFAPADEEEIELWRFLRRRYGHVSVERVLSGQGLVHIHEWLIQGRSGEIGGGGDEAPTRDSASVITQRALHGSGSCREALLRFCGILGGVAGNLALTGLARGGVYLGGGIPPKILPVLEASDFQRRFTAKGRFSDFLSRFPVWVIQNERAALMGAARAALALSSLDIQ